MHKLKKYQDGFTAIELVLAVILLAVVGGISYQIYHTGKNKVKPSTSSVASVSKVSTTLPSGTSNTSLQNDLSALSSSNTQVSQDLNASNNGINDQSTFTSY